MSVLIQNMDMPKSCDECPYAEYYGEEDNRKCQILGSYVDIIDDNGETVRDDNCPFIEIPTPHGRLIDADVACEKYKDEDSLIAELAYRKIRNAPTVIEAEG